LNIRINKVLYEINILGFLLSVFLIVGCSNLIKNYVEAKEVEKKGHLIRAVIIRKEYKSRGRSYSIVEIPSESIKQHLYITDFDGKNNGDTILIQYLSPTNVILEPFEDGFYLGPNNLFAVISGILVTLFILYFSISKSENLSKKEKYELKRKKYLYKKGEKLTH
jgi:hypothetical protein